MINTGTSKNILTDWNQTPIFKDKCMGKIYAILFPQCFLICGETVFGKGNDLSVVGLRSVIAFLKKSVNMDIYKAVPSSQITLLTPTRSNLVSKLIDLCARANEYYQLYPQTIVVDNWSKRVGVDECAQLKRSVYCQHRLLETGGKRFSEIHVSVDSQIEGLIKSSSGLLAEGYVIAFLNTCYKCPVCNVIGKIGWCDNMSLFTSGSVDAFRDGVCVNCSDNGIITLFEIKTRWENCIEKNGTYGGSFAALNTLMSINANVYLVVVSRDTGNVRIGKITSGRLRANKNWLYSLQENLGWGSPSSYIICADGFKLLPVKMSKLLTTLSKKYCNSIFNEVLLEYFKSDIKTM